MIVELVGPAGAGKTTLARVLRQYDEHVSMAAEIELRKVEQIPLFLASLPFLLSLILGRPGRRFTWEEVKYLVYLRAWPDLLRRQASNGDKVIPVDHGPVFKMATLNAFGPEGLRGRDYERWWSKLFDRWAETLDLVIWLDAPDPILMERINTRGQSHVVKERSALEVFRFLDCYRSSYQYILARLAEDGGPAMIQFDTNQASDKQIADRLLAACGLKNG
jgi:broad-specificity NMP kinase